MEKPLFLKRCFVSLCKSALVASAFCLLRELIPAYLWDSSIQNLGFQVLKLLGVT
jgi:hypothetical protein